MTAKHAGKVVIFVGGSSYSGSTMLDLMLGNDDRGFSCGEISSYFNPTKHPHHHPRCGCGNELCDTWKEIRKHGASRLYQTIFEMHPNVTFIVDSSKNPLRIGKQQKRLRESGVSYRNILIWKHPFQAAYSYKKRGVYGNWERNWVSYHRLYCSLFRNWRSVSYEAVTSTGKALRRVCCCAGISYFPGKEKYWERRHCIIGGNHSARIHLQRMKTAEHAHAREMMYSNKEPYVERRHRGIYRDEGLRLKVRERMEQSPYISAIIDALIARDVGVQGPNGSTPERIRMSQAELLLRLTSRWFKTTLGRVRHS